MASGRSGYICHKLWLESGKEICFSSLTRNRLNVQYLNDSSVLNRGHYNEMNRSDDRSALKVLRPHI